MKTLSMHTVHNLYLKETYAKFKKGAVILSVINVCTILARKNVKNLKDGCSDWMWMEKKSQNNE